MFILTAGAITAALFFSSRSEKIASLAYVGGEATKPEIAGLSVEAMKEAPPLSALISGKYDGIIRIGENEDYVIDSMKNNDLENTLSLILSDADLPEETSDRGSGSMIIGFLLMFLLMESSMLMFTLTEDLEHHSLKRVLSAPVSTLSCLLSHGIFNIICLVIPTFLILYLIKFILGINIGFSALVYLGLLGVICLFGTAFCLFMSSVFKRGDTANMAGSTFLIITSVLSGSFYSLENGNDTLGKIVKFLPQKAFLTFTEGLEKGRSIQEIFPHLAYITVISVLLLFLGTLLIKKYAGQGFTTAS